MAETVDKPHAGTARAASPLEINLREIIASRISSGKRKWIPRFLVGALEKLICQDRLNELLRATFPARGSGFASRLLRELDIEVEVKGLSSLPPGRYMFAGNHPLGGLDGIALISVLGQRYGDSGIRFLVNDLLMNVEPLREVFLPVNKYGSQGRAAATAINQALESDMQIFQFPAGLVSRLHSDGSIKDLDWQKSFVTKAMEYNRDIVPVRFEALNRKRFYRLARIRKNLGIKLNLEQALLPAELCAASGSKFRITFGSPLRIETLRKEGKNPKDTASAIRDIVYRL